MRYGPQGLERGTMTRGLSYDSFMDRGTADHQSAFTVPPEGFPLLSSTASHPSRTMSGTMRSAATGSAHHHPSQARSPRPRNSKTGSKVKTAVFIASARSALLSNAFDARNFMTANAGTAMRENMERTRPKRLSSDFSL